MSLKERMKNFFTVKNVLITFLILVMMVGSTWVILRGDGLVDQQRQCCADICAEFNQECRGWYMDTLECTYEYDDFGYSGVREIFSFVIDEEAKLSICGG